VWLASKGENLLTSRLDGRVARRFTPGVSRLEITLSGSAMSSQLLSRGRTAIAGALYGLRTQALLRRVAGLVACLGVIAACDTPVATEPLVPFTGEAYDLVAIDGTPLPAALEFQGVSYLVASGTMAFVDDTTADWELRDLTPVEPGPTPILAVIGADSYRQPRPDSLEVGGRQLGFLGLTPWAAGRRETTTLELRTLDPAPTDPRLPDLSTAPFGFHDLRFQRRE
jgi:hypothetical protein